MAGEWIKMEACTPDKAEVLAITARMGWDDPDLTVGKLFRIWRWFDQHTTDGNADGVTFSLLDRIVGVSGFCSAMQSVGWLVAQDAGVTLPNFDRHNGNTSKNRALTAKRVANHKANAKANATGNADTVTDALPREEKRREDIDTSPNGDGDKSEASDVVDPCPHQQIIELYHRHLPMGRQVREWTPARSQALRARWREKPKRQSLEWWERFFAYVAESDFLTGKTATPGRKPFEVSLDWLVKAENMAKVIEGAYQNAPVEVAA